jgi:hypothetical protein
MEVLAQDGALFIQRFPNYPVANSLILKGIYAIAMVPALILSVLVSLDHSVFCHAPHSEAWCSGQHKMKQKV